MELIPALITQGKPRSEPPRALLFKGIGKAKMAEVRQLQLFGSQPANAFAVPWSTRPPRAVGDNLVAFQFSHIHQRRWSQWLRSPGLL